MDRIIKWFFPKEEKFFDLLKEQSANALEGAKKFNELVHNYPSDVKKRRKLIAGIRRLENMGDEILHKIINELNKTFITPLDKEDIHRLSCLLDDIIDFIDAIAESFVTYNLKKMDVFIKDTAGILLKAVTEVDKAVFNLKKLRASGKFHITINSLENESDRLHSKAISSLFQNGMGAIDVIKYKEVYENLESAIDKCEDISDVIESIVVKHA